MNQLVAEDMVATINLWQKAKNLLMAEDLVAYVNLWCKIWWHVSSCGRREDRTISGISMYSGQE
jgi:hypothetical protein